MDDKFLSYSQHSTNRDYSNFDGTIQNLYTSKFGELCPVFCKPVLAGDSFKIALNSEVKVSTLAAPTYSNIKQNFYSFFVPLQSYWSHWNDFITNGSEFQNVYGSNLTNQDLNNPWKIPSVLTNQLQFITKLANGFSIPILQLSARRASAIDTDVLASVPSSSNGSNGKELVLVDGVPYFQFHFNLSTVGLFETMGMETYGVWHDSDDYILTNFLQIYFPSFKRICQICPYIHYDNLQLIQSSEGNGYISFRCSSIDFGLSIDDMPEFIVSNSSSGQTQPFASLNFSDTFNYMSSPLVQYIKIRQFCDEHSQSIDINNSPFGFKSFQYDSTSRGLVLNATRFYRKNVNIKELDDFTYDNAMFNSNSFTISSAKCVQLSNFWYKDYALGKVGSSTDTIFVRAGRNLVLRFNAEDGFGTDFLSLFESDDFYPQLVENSYCYASDLSIPAAPQLDQLNYNLKVIDDSFSNTYPYLHVANPDDGDDPNQIHLNAYLRNGYNCALCDTLFPFYVNEYEKLYSIFNETFIVVENLSDRPRVRNYLSYIPLIDSSAISNGMTTFTFMLYLSKSVCRSLDFVGVPFEGFTVRDVFPYLGESINLLPFMAQSKIWDEYFRNRTVSSPELDFCQVNGSALYLYNYYKSLITYRGSVPAYIPDDENYQNSWVIPFDVLPKNGVGTFNLQSLFPDDLSVKVAIQGFNEFHYYNVTCFADLFSLLTGFQVNHSVMHQVIKPYVSLFDQYQDKYLDVLYGAIVDRFYLPSYYNGLLHFKYQNFNKDYFSSALLDAMSGANQEEIPDNVTELRQAEARQSFWEQTAVARSVKKFFNKMFGTTPTHMEKDRPLLLGQSHNRISIGEIIQTSGTAETPQGTRTGIAGGHDVSGICKHEFNEQGYLIILSSITLDSQYYQGLQKSLSPYDSYLDYPFPQFYHIGNQSINMRELNYFSNPIRPLTRLSTVFGNAFRYLDGSPLPASRITTVANNPIKVTQDNYQFDTNPNYCINSDTKFDSVFGYVPRFTEWKFNFDELHGDFRSTLMPWNTFRTFHNIPFLSHNFVNWELSGFNYDLNRLFAVTDDSDKFICSLFINVEMHRPIPYYTIPKSSVN